ncbi:hypothetical protein HDK90DRAFT_60419 [Phyllosticta capitalensis]|uniref:Uncharacterized protein n=1 Tax=Phyllosticta capitalensis TaxID=121624 RepID=A0ABR1YER6_9PEZI
MADLDPPPLPASRRTDRHPSKSPRHKSPKKQKPALTRTSSSLDITPGLESFSPLEDADVAGRRKTKVSEHVEVANATNTSPVRRLNDGHLISRPTEDPFGPVDNAAAPKMSSDGVETNNNGFATTFYGSIHGIYHNCLRELDHWFGEINPHDLSSKTLREIAQCELLHLLAITTDEPGTYRGCIRKAYEICRAMEDRDIATNLLKKTHHLDIELDDEFVTKDNASAIHRSGRSCSKPLDTIAEEDNDSQCGPVEQSLPASLNAGTPSPGNRNKNDKSTASSQACPEPSEPTEITEEHLAKQAYDEYVDTLGADVLKRQQATDRYILYLGEDVARRKRATDQYLAGLEAMMSK